MRLIAVILLSLAAATAQAGAPLLRADDAAFSVRTVDPQSGALAVSVRLAGRPIELRLLPMLRLEAEFAPFVPAIGARQDRIYAGVIAGARGSWVRLTRVGSGWIGAAFDGLELWYFEPAALHAQRSIARGMASDAILVYRGDDVDLPGGFDLGGRPAHGPAEPRQGPTAAAADARAGTPRVSNGAPRYLKLTLVLDTEFQSRYGANAASTAAAVLNITDGLYRAQTDVQVSLHHLRALASNGTLTSTNSDTLLDAFTSFMPTSGIPFAGLAHLLSGKDFDGSTIGLAWVGTACRSDFGYGIDQITFSTALGGSTLAHEIGHNFDADHDSDGNACPASGFVMAAILNLGSPPTSFSTCSLTYFNGFLASPRACLNDPPPSPTVLFANGFEP